MQDSTAKGVKYIDVQLLKYFFKPVIQGHASLLARCTVLTVGGMMTLFHNSDTSLPRGIHRGASVIGKIPVLSHGDSHRNCSHYCDVLPTFIIQGW